MEELKLLFNSWQESQNVAYIHEGISSAQRHLAIVGVSKNERATLFEFLALFLNINFQNTQNWQNLEDATQSSQFALNETPSDHAYRGQRLSNVGALYHIKYLRKGNLQDLRMALRAVKGALASTTSTDPRRTRLVLDMSNLLRYKCQETRDLKDIENAIRYAKSALSTKTAIKYGLTALPNREPHQNGCGLVDRAGTAYYLPIETSTISDDLSNLDKSDNPKYVLLSDQDGIFRLQDWDQTSNGVPGQDSYQISNLRNLSTALAIRYQKSGEPKDLEEAIQHMEEALKFSRTDNTEISKAVNFLSDLLHMRYSETGDLRILEKAISFSEEAVSVAPVGHPGRLLGLISLSTLLRSRFNAKGELKDLEKAVSNAEEGLLITTKSRASRIAALNALGAALYSRHKITGTFGDLQRAIDAIENGLSTLPTDQVVRTKMLYNLATYTGSMYEDRGSLEDLHKAISLVEQAASKETGRDFVLQADIWSLWSNLLMSKYERMGILADLEGAIEKAEKGLLSITTDNHTEQATRLGGLSLLLTRRYDRTSALEDLDAAVRISRKAVSAAPLGHVHRALSLNNLGLALGSRFRRTRVSADLDEAIESAEEAISVTSPQDVNRITILGSLANRLLTRFELNGSRDDLENGLLRHLDTVAATPPNHPQLGLNLHNLSASLGAKYEVTGDERVLQEAIRVCEEAISVTPQDHPHRAARLINLGKLSTAQRKLRVEKQDPDLSLEIYLEAWKCFNGPPLVRIEASRLAIKLLVDKSEWAESSLLAESALELLPQINLRSIRREDQEHVISFLSGQAATACSLALQVGKSPLHALQLLELGRGIIIGLNIDFRSDLSTLKQHNSRLYEEFERLITVIDSRDQEPENAGLRPNIALQRRIEAVRELDELLTHIRKMPGLQSFQLPPSETDLINMAQEGTIVVFNSTKLRSDAIIVTSTGIRAINLPSLCFSEVLQWTQFITTEVFKRNLRTSCGLNKSLQKLLSRLWLTTIQPVIQYLHLEMRDSVRDLARIWWIGVGPMAILPFHAAGDHTVSCRDNTLNYCVSSYTPTIKALSFSRGRKLALFDGSRPRLLVAAMPETPGERNLLGAEQEVADIQKVCTPHFFVTPLARPNVAKVLENLKSHQVAHFACHGNSDATNPSESHLLLFGSNDCQGNPGTAERLTVREISAVKNKQAQLIYLSACYSADSMSVSLVDEVIHLASAFQLVGFSHAVGTLWASDDRMCVMVTRNFYESLLSGTSMGNEHRRVAVALHEAVVAARNSEPSWPLKWAPFIHLGA